MAKDQSIPVKDVVHKLQLSLLEGIENEDQLFAAGSLMSHSDYNDVVTERMIANLCGYPLCKNSLPLDRTKGRYRISLKEHRVYDLQETRMFCSSGCLINSRAFGGSLHEERCAVVNPAKLDEILRLFDDLRLVTERLGKDEDLGLSKLKIQEKEGSSVGEVPLDQWAGPSNAIEGYVPQRDRKPKPSTLKAQGEGLKANSKTGNGKDFFINDMDFMSTIITNDEYSISKLPSDLSSTPGKKLQGQKGRGSKKDLKEKSCAPPKKKSGKASRKSKEETTKITAKGEFQNQHHASTSKPLEMASGASTSQSEGAETSTSSEPPCKLSLKPSGAKKVGQSVTWADEKVDSTGSRRLCEVREIEDTKAGIDFIGSENVVDTGNLLRIESAKACAMALNQAAEAVASGNVDASDAVSDAGIIILPHPENEDQANLTDNQDIVVNWPKKSGLVRSEYFDPEDSWYDSPPDGFSLKLSPFATMWNALFEWVTSSSLAFIYGRDESSHEDYLFVNGREYPRKIVLGEGRSSEIKQTVEGCLARASPGLVADLRLSVPVSTLELAMGLLLNTMSFVYAVPAFRMKQWQVIALLFIEALSVCRVPALTFHMTDRRVVLHKVLDGAQIELEQYEAMKDLMIPLGRAPQFSAQSGA